MSNNDQTNQPFYLGICMAGAVSAGAYTAGVMDYLIEALQEWEKRRGQAGVPTHRVEIPVIGGASAGGMTGILTAAAINNDIVPVKKLTTDIFAEHPENKFYHTWVDLIGKDMFSKLLDTSDIKRNELHSALNSNFIDEIADRVTKVNLRKWKPLPPFFSKRLKIFTTLTNLEGFEYNVAFKSKKQSDHNYYMQIHNDYACFELTEDHIDGHNGGWIPLNLKEKKNVQIAQDAAMATGAFPVGLKSRKLKRGSQYVNNLKWLKEIAAIDPIDKENYTSLNVDGGMINNEPFEKVRDVLNEITKQCKREDYENLNSFASTVVMIDPFPSVKAGRFKMDQGLLRIAGLTLSTAISQVRSKPSYIADAMDSQKGGQYIIAPSRRRPKLNGNEVSIKGEKAIACGALNGFSGFLSKEFRIHDYFLGRHNCRIFLRDYFTITKEALLNHPIFCQGYTGVNLSEFESCAEPNAYQIIPIFDKDDTFPIPTFSSGTTWPLMSKTALKAYKRQIKRRVQAILLNLTALNFYKRILLWIGAKLILNGMITKAIMRSIREELNEWQLMHLKRSKGDEGTEDHIL